MDYRGVLEQESVQKKVGDSVEQYLGRTIMGKVPGIGEFLKRNAGQAMRAVSGFAPEETEKQALKLLNAPEQQKKLAKFLQGILEKQGLAVEIGRVQIERAAGDGGEEHSGPDSEVQPDIRLSPELEEGVLDALSAYLKASVSEKTKMESEELEKIPAFVERAAEIWRSREPEEMCGSTMQFAVQGFKNFDAVRLTVTKNHLDCQKQPLRLLVHVPAKWKPDYSVQQYLKTGTREEILRYLSSEEGKKEIADSVKRLDEARGHEDPRDR